MAWTTPRTWAVGEVFTASLANLHIRDNTKLLYRELSRTEIITDVPVSATAAATADLVVSSGAVTYEAKPIRITFYSPNVVTGVTAGSQVFVQLWDDTSDLGRLASVGVANGTQAAQTPVMAQRKLTPTAASHTYKAMAWRATSNGTVGATSPLMPAFLLIEAAES